MTGIPLMPFRSNQVGYRKPLLANQPSKSSVNEPNQTHSDDEDGELNPPQTQRILSTWGVGWRIPTLMVVCYFLALFIACSHVALFLYINGKPADGPDRVAPQSYITTASYILASAFQYALKTALGVAFAQHLWLVLRCKAIRVWTIETLFSLRNNPFSIFRPLAIQASPVLFLLALLSWALVVMTSFPPGAISIRTDMNITGGSMTVSTFNASYIGNGSGSDAAIHSLDSIFQIDSSGNQVEGNKSSRVSDFVTSSLVFPPPLSWPHNLQKLVLTLPSSLFGGDFPQVLQRLGVRVLVGGQSLTTPSPCGQNCSYSITFDGPYFQCDNTTSTLSLDSSTRVIYIYNGSYLSPKDTDPNSDVPSNFTGASFITNTLSPIAVSADNTSDAIMLVQKKSLTCVPFRAQYTMFNGFERGVQSFNVSAQPVQRLMNYSEYDAYPNSVRVPGFSNPTQPLPYSFGTVPANWSENALRWYRDLNLINIIDVLAGSLAGSYSSEGAFSAGTPGGFPNATTIPGYGDTLWYTSLEWADQTLPGVAGPSNGTIIQNTRFNIFHDQLQPRVTAGEFPKISFGVTQDLLNSALVNLTISVIPFYNLWSTTVPVTRQTSYLAYSLSNPFALFVPYFLSLLLALPFIIFGGLALRANGVTAMDGGFVQLLATSTGSSTLEKHSAGTCLGGYENVGQELKDLKLRYGELIAKGRQGSRGGLVRRAGFGTDNEIVPLLKGETYGYAE